MGQIVVSSHKELVKGPLRIKWECAAPAGRLFTFLFSAGFLFAGFAWASSNFFQIRGVQHMLTSRIFLEISWVFAVLVIWGSAWVLFYRRRYVVTLLGASVLLACAIAIDRRFPIPPVPSVVIVQHDQIQQHETLRTDAQAIATSQIPQTSSRNDTAKILADLEELKKARQNTSLPVNKPFLIAIGAALVSLDLDHAVALSLVYFPPPLDVKRVQGISALWHIGVINNQTTSTLIGGIKVEGTVDRKHWYKMTVIPTTTRHIVIPFRDPKDNQLRGSNIDQSKFFDREVNHRVLQPGDIVHGWLALGYPEEFKSAKRIGIRVTIQDEAGKTSTAIS
jgi:hypothetical protein